MHNLPTKENDEKEREEEEKLKQRKKGYSINCNTTRNTCKLYKFIILSAVISDMWCDQLVPKIQTVEGLNKQ